VGLGRGRVKAAFVERFLKAAKGLAKGGHGIRPSF
jgi:hypothetical protein